MLGDPFFSLPEWLIGAAVLILFLASGELGFQLGRRKLMRSGTTAKGQIDLMQGALLATVGLLLGFTFSMAIYRYDTRKERVVEEANTISTTALRAGLLPAAYRGESVRLLLEYVELRISGPGRPLPTNAESLDKVLQRSDQIQLRLWSLATRAATENPQAETTSLFVQSLNDMIDAQGKRAAALRNHIPETVLWLLLLATLLCTWFVGFGSGAAGERANVALLMFGLVTMMVFLLILDLDRPQRGLIRISQTSMREAHDLVRQLVDLWH